MKKNYYAVIMAGGVGTRFWPVSTKKYPKQFHDMLGSGVSLLQQTFNRIKGLIPSENIFIATNKKYKDQVLQQLQKIKPTQVFLEPVMRNTAPCILAMALKIYAKNPEGIMLVAPSDHWIEPTQFFLQALQKSFNRCQKEDMLMTLGIQPRTPNTGYGYIECDISDKRAIKSVLQFREKPDEKTAQEFIKRGNFLWNAGIFVWSAKSIIKAFKNHLPNMYHLFSDDAGVWNTEKESDFLQEKFALAENISIDFGILEKAKNVSVLPVNFDWCDLGTWGSLYEKKYKDPQKNVSIGGTVFAKDSHGNIIRTQPHKKVILQGLKNFIVVEKQDVLMICPRSQEQSIKQTMQEVEDYFGSEVFEDL